MPKLRTSLVMHKIAFVLACLAIAIDGHRSRTASQQLQGQRHSAGDPLKEFARLLLTSEQSAAWHIGGAGSGRGLFNSAPLTSLSNAQRVSDVQAFFGGAKKRIVVAGACSDTGQSVARDLASQGFAVTALCTSRTGRLIKDDNDQLSDTSVKFTDDGSVEADALVIASDIAPSGEAVSTLLKTCAAQGLSHAVILSRLGVTKALNFGVRAWKEVEDAATKVSEEVPSLGVHILRVGDPVIGGPFYKLNPNLNEWGNAKSMDGYKTLEVASGDELSQSGFGSNRANAAASIAGLLRRGPEKLASYSVAATLDPKQPTSAADLDKMFEEAGGPAQSSGSSTATLSIDMTDTKIKDLTRFVNPVRSPLDLLFGPPAVSGQYWGVIVLIIWGFYLTTTDEYIAKSGVDLWGKLK